MRGSNYGNQFPPPHIQRKEKQKQLLQTTTPQPQMPNRIQPPNRILQSHNSPKAPFLVENFNRPSWSGYLKRTNRLTHGKRKCDSENTFHPVTKQQITEERIASSMQQLSLDTNHPITDHQQSSSVTRTVDEGFFEEVQLSSSDEELDVDQQESELWTGSKFKQLYFTPGVKESLKQFDDDVLPHRIINEICHTSLALVPYKPPAEIPGLLISTKNETFEMVCQRNISTTDVQSSNVKGEMDVDESDGN